MTLKCCLWGGLALQDLPAAGRAPGEQDSGGGGKLRSREVQSLYQGHTSSSVLRTFKDPVKISENLKYLSATKWEKKTVKSKLINVKCLQNVTLGQLH